MDRSQEPQTVPAGLPAVLCPGPSAPSQTAADRQRSASASNLPALERRADNLLPSFQSAGPTSPHRATAYASHFLSAKSGDASKLLQSLADTLRALQTSELFGNPWTVLLDGRRPAGLRLTLNKPQLHKQEVRSKRVNWRTR